MLLVAVPDVLRVTEVGSVELLLCTAVMVTVLVDAPSFIEVADVVSVTVGATSLSTIDIVAAWFPLSVALSPPEISLISTVTVSDVSISESFRTVRVVEPVVEPAVIVIVLLASL